MAGLFMFGCGSSFKVVFDEKDLTNLSKQKEELSLSEKFEEQEIHIGEGDYKLDGILTIPKDN